MLDCLVFDIETVPDVDLGRRLFSLDGLGDVEIAQAMFHRQVEKSGSEFLPLHQHRVVAIAVALRNRSGFRVWSLGEEGSDEKEIITRFFDGIERFTPTIVSWNGGGFDLLNAFPGRRQRGEFLQCQSRIAQNAHQQVVEVVGDSPGQYAQAFQFLRLLELCL